MTHTLEGLLAEQGWLQGLARGLLADPQGADDVVQDTWLAALRRPPGALRSARAWLATVARNFARQGHRRAGARDRRERGAAVPEALPSAADVVERAELRRRIVEAVLALDEPYRQAVLLRYFEGLEAAEIARRSGEPAATVRTRLRRGLEQLRTRLDAAHGGDRRAWALLLVPLVSGDAAAAVSGGTAAGLAGGLVAAGALLLVVLWSGRSEPPSATRPPTVPVRGLGTRETGPAPAAAVPASQPPATPRPADASPSGAPAPVRAEAVAEAPLGVSGHVRDLAGAPVAGVRITVEGEAVARIPHVKGRPVDQHALFRRRRATTAADGTWQADRLTAGAVRVTAESDRHAIRAPAEVEVVAGTAGVDFVVVPHPTVRCLVVDATTNTPIATATPSYRPFDRDGEQLVLHLATGPHPVTFEAEGYASSTVTIVAPAAGEALHPGPIALEPAVRHAGRVLDTRGEAVAHAVVVLARAGARPGRTALRVVATGRDGTFVFAGLEPGEYRLAVRAHPERGLDAVVRVPADVGGADVVLAEGIAPPAGDVLWAGLRGQLVDVNLADVPLLPVFEALGAALGARVDRETSKAIFGQTPEDSLRINLQLTGVALGDFVDLVTGMTWLAWDDATGTLRTRRAVEDPEGGD